MASRVSRPAAGMASLIGFVVFVASVFLGIFLGDATKGQPTTAATPQAPSTTAPSPSGEQSPAEEAPTEVFTVTPSSNAPVPSPSRTYPEREIKRQSTTTYRLSELTGGEAKGRTIAVIVEKGLPIDPDEAAKIIIDTLNDKRGWAGVGHPFRLVTDPAEADLQLAITSPSTTDKECKPLRTRGQVSCTPDDHHVYLNSDRWLVGVPHVPDLAQYRRYVISHEVGHSLGRRHESCPGPGKPAPVMVQQSYSYRLEKCVPNEWITVA